MFGWSCQKICRLRRTPLDTRNLIRTPGRAVGETRILGGQRSMSRYKELDLDNIRILVIWLRSFIARSARTRQERASAPGKIWSWLLTTAKRAEARACRSRAPTTITRSSAENWPSSRQDFLWSRISKWQHSVPDQSNNHLRGSTSSQLNPQTKSGTNLSPEANTNCGRKTQRSRAYLAIRLHPPGGSAARLRAMERQRRTRGHWAHRSARLRRVARM